MNSSFDKHYTQNVGYNKSKFICFLYNDFRRQALQFVEKSSNYKSFQWFQYNGYKMQQRKIFYKLLYRTLKF